jgi:hypothetical protein
MATSDQEQRSVNVNQHKRMAMGVPLNGQSMQEKGQPQQNKGGGLSQASKKKKRENFPT